MGKPGFLREVDIDRYMKKIHTVGNLPEIINQPICLKKSEFSFFFYKVFKKENGHQTEGRIAESSKKGICNKRIMKKNKS